MPARQPDSGLERFRLSRSLAGGQRTSARHEQLSRVHRQALSRAVRGLVRARHRERSGDDQGDRGVDRRSRVRRRLGDRASARRPHRQARRRRRIGSGRPRRRGSAEPRGAPRHRARARRPHRRPAAVRDSRVQDGEAVSRAPARGDARGRRRVPDRRQRRRQHRRSTSCGAITTRWCSPAARRRRAI